MKSNQTPVGPVCSNFPKETFSTLAELIKIIVDKKLYLLPILWPSEDTRPYLDCWDYYGYPPSILDQPGYPSAILEKDYARTAWTCGPRQLSLNIHEERELLTNESRGKQN